MNGSSPEFMIEHLARLPEREALRAFANAINRQVLFRLFLVAAIVVVGIALQALFQGYYPQLILPFLNLLVLRWLYSNRESRWFERHFETLLLAWLSLQLLAVRAMFFSPNQGFHWLDWALPAVVLLFHLSASQAALPLLGLWLISSGRHILLAFWGRTELDFSLLTGQTAMVVVVWSLVSNLRLRRQHHFLNAWREGHRRYRERLRLREELDAARDIQLGMLPMGDPNLNWLEVAGRSIPASEVGGDYYDYLPITEERLAVVIGDVSGHGVASGLLLSGIRSCLYLLQETPLPPAEILAKLDRMIRKTTGRRVLVTMIYAIFDHVEKVLCFSAAAHPPLLRYNAATDEVEEWGLEALPLGTRIGSSLRERRISYQSGDLFVFATDGIAEVLNRSGQFYGSERLQRCLGQLRRHSARQVRDGILNDLWSFKGDFQQPDDITLVVVKVR